MPQPLDEALVAVAEAIDPLDAVAIVELGHEALDDVVQPWAEAATGDDPGRRPRGIEEDFLPRPGHFETQDLLRREIHGRRVFIQNVIVENALGIPAKPDLDTADIMQRRRNRAFS